MQTITSSPAADPPLLIPLTTPLTALSAPQTTQSTEAISVGPCSPPVPKKLAERIWKKEFIDFRDLLPSQLGAPEPTVFDLFGKTDKARPKKQISTIQEWVICFNTYSAIILMREPERTADLLAYCSIIIKASIDYDDMPWLDYDTHFRRQAATKPNEPWARLDAALWTIYFTRAKAKNTHLEEDTNLKKVEAGGKSAKSTDKPRANPYTTTPICRKWNSPEGCNLQFCRYRHCCLKCSSTLHKAYTCQTNQQRQVGGGPPFRPDAARR